MTNIEAATGEARIQLLPKEREIFSDFYMKYGSQFSRWRFAQHFGPPAFPVEDLPEGIRYWAEIVSRLRADVIAWKGEQPYLFEIKEVAKPAAIGQLHAYKAYWAQEFPGSPQPKLAIICRYAPKYIEEPAAAAGVEIFVV